MRASELVGSDLPYGERMRQAALEGRRLRGTTELTELLGELGRGTAYERTLGLTIAQAAGSVDYVTRLLRDPDPTVQSRALSAVRRSTAVSDDDLRILYDDAPAALRTKLLHVVRAGKRSHLAARLIDEHRERWGDQAAAGLLSTTDDQTVERLLPDLAYCLSTGEWQRLGERHPKVVLAYASSTLPSGADRDEWWQGTAYGVVGALDHDEAQVAGLLKTALPDDQLPLAIISILGRLIDADPAGALAILLTPSRAAALGAALTPAVRRRLHRYSDYDLIALGRLLWPDLTQLLSDLPPSRRATIFTAVTSTVELGQTVLPTELLAVLPRELRFEQARRMLTLAPIAETARERWRITAFLPYDEAFALLRPEITQPDADDRAWVYRAVIGSAGYSRQSAHVESALTWATRARNERDTVRQGVVRATNELPPSTYTDLLVAPLQTLLTDALEARDTSWYTRSLLGHIAETAVREGALRQQEQLLEWGLQAHARITENQGTIQLYGIIDGLPRGQENAVYDVLREYVDAAVARREFILPMGIARAFGKRGWGNEHLHHALEQAVWSNQEPTVGQATELWLEPTATRSERIERIIGRDVGMARWDPVWATVTELRTDLLDAVLAAPERIRRFERNHAAWQVSSAALRRWLPRQHARYAELLAAAASDANMPAWARANAVSALGRVPGVGCTAVEAFLSSDAVLLQEAALSALAWTDSPEQVLPVLLENVGDDRARVAIYAASRAARFVRPSRLPSLLLPVLIGAGVKVTSRKEAARMLGQLRVPGASVVLTEAWSSAHRDVKAAITSAASQYLLHEPASWALLQQAVHDTAATANVLTQRSSYGMAAKYRSRYADLLIAVTNRPEPEVVRRALLSLRRWGRWNPSAAPVCAGFITDLTTRAWNDATTALVGLVATDPQLGLDDLISVVRLLVRLESDPNLPNALPDRDHPARQRLTAVVHGLTSSFNAKPAESRQVLKTVAAELTDPDFLGLRLQLLTYAIDWADLSTELATLATAVADRPLAALTATDLLQTRLAATEPQWTPDSLEPATTNLLTTAVDHAGLNEGLFACALVSAAGPRSGWAPSWRNLLVALRNHPALDVRQRALDLTTTPET
ncbi:hypothetical protein EV646_109348 [Kribbella antiqua]|uniref:HEAT repeat protein n=1 Tax=Kribbella antiqua TaxID=2512217 RepID=A0A4R2IJS4_9ACTN|nr:hypothetical protein [Kribbella antiqua]TCO45173.1 hypothetical protein EV646_109348 [Kribbella antiqua]